MTDGDNTMKNETMAHISQSVQRFRLPRYDEIPTVGLYLEQTAKYISEFLSPLEEGALTPSMISNYVKKHLIDSPVKKQYSREQIAYLFFIALAKNVLSLEALRSFIQIQKQSYGLDTAYNYLCTEFEDLLQFTFELQDSAPDNGHDSTDEKRLMYSCIVAVTQKIYLEKCLEAIIAEENT